MKTSASIEQTEKHEVKVTPLNLVAYYDEAMLEVFSVYELTYANMKIPMP